MKGKSLTDLKEAELADVRARIAEQQAERSERFHFDLRPHDLWWRLGRWTKRFKKLKDALLALAGVIGGFAALLVAIQGLRNWRTTRSVGPAEQPPSNDVPSIFTDRVDQPDAGRESPIKSNTASQPVTKPPTSTGK